MQGEIGRMQLCLKGVGHAISTTSKGTSFNKRPTSPTLTSLSYKIETVWAIAKVSQRSKRGKFSKENTREAKRG